MSIVDVLIKSITDSLKECDDLELLYLIQSLLESTES